jgi:hypothetical protein
MHEEEFPKIIAQRPSPEMEERAVLGTAEGLIAEGFPGTAGRSRDDVIDVVRRVHAETCELVYSGRMRAADAAAYEFRRYAEELRRDDQ